MSFNVKTIQPFDKELKRLAKKYPSLKVEFAQLIDSLAVNPFQGKRLIENCFKIRLSIKSKNVGKSGGARVIINVIVVSRTVYLLAIYDKSDKNNISDNELKYLIKQTGS